MSAAGGRRARQGRPSGFQQEAKAASYAAAIDACFPAAIAALPKLFKALEDAALGYKVATKIKYTGAQLRQMHLEEEAGYQLADGSVMYVYLRAPDVAAQRLLLEHTKGRASTQAPITQETQIRLVTSVPRPKREGA